MKNSTNNPTSIIREQRSMASVTRIINLDTPAGAREYLANLYVTGKGYATFVSLASGRELHFKDMSDEEAMHYAKEIWQVAGNLKRGGKG